MNETNLSTIDKQLLTLLADGHFHSGTQLAQALGLSRSAIWKHLQNLNSLGLEISAVSGKGYKLNPALQLLNAEQILQQLEPRATQLQGGIDIFDHIASTNRYLMELAQQEQANGRICLAEYQSAGRGRRGRTWVSPFGHNIYLSVLWRYSAGPNLLSGLSLAVGIACAQALQSLGVSDVGLKWPNDVYWRQRKLAGILIEVSGESAGPCHAVIGLGLNVYLSGDQAQSIDQAWVDLQHILGLDCLQQRNRLVATLLNHLLPIIADYETTGLAPYLERWRDFDCLHGQEVQLHFTHQTISGTAQGIDQQGLLRLQTNDGSIRHYASGELRVRPI